MFDNKSSGSFAEGVQGVVEFASHEGLSYRYEIVAKDDKLRIWLEDRTTKQQWQTKELKLDEFVEPNAVIPNATFEDYVACFVDCLQSDVSSDDFTRELAKLPFSKGALKMTLKFKLRASKVAWTATYCFHLAPIPLDPVTVLASKIRDQAEQLERLEGLLNAKTPSSPVVVRATAKNKISSSDPFVWIADVPVDAVAFQADGVIRFQCGGAFHVTITVHHSNFNSATAFEVQLNGETVMTCKDGDQVGYRQITTVAYAFTAKPADEIIITYRGKGCAYTDSSVVICKLG